MDAFDNAVKKYTPFLENDYVSAALSVFLIVYAGMAAPKLPEYIAQLFDYTLVKLVMFFLIVYISRKNATVAIIAAVAVMVSIMTLNKIKFGKELMSVVDGERNQDPEEVNYNDVPRTTTSGNSVAFVSLHEESNASDDASVHMSVEEHRAQEGAHVQMGEERSADMLEMAEEVKRRIASASAEEGRQLDQDEVKHLCAGVIAEMKQRTTTNLNMGTGMEGIVGYDNSTRYGSA